MDDLVRDFPMTNVRIPGFARGIKILLVDEDLPSLFHISSMLEEFSFKVTMVKQASVALSMIRDQKNNFRLVIANINMPDMNNPSFLHEIMKKVPVILMSSDSSIAERAIVEGASLFIKKPVALKNLKSVWQHVDWKLEEQKEKNHQESSEDRGGNRIGSYGTKINETGTWSTPLMEDNIIKEASGTIRPNSGGIIIEEAGNMHWPSTNLLKPIESGFFSIPNTACKDHGNLFADPFSQRMQHKEKIFIIIEDENDSLQNTKASKKQEGSNLKGQLSEKEGKKQVKKTKTNLEIKNSGGSGIKGKGKKKVDGDSNISVKKRCCSAWNLELHSEFTEAISALADENTDAIPRTIEEDMNTPGITRKQIASHQQKHEADRKRMNKTGTTSLPSRHQLPSYSHAIIASISQPPSCNHAITAFAPPLQRHNLLISQHGQGDLNFGFAGTSTQSSNPKPLTQPEKYGAESPRIDEAGTTNLPSLSRQYGEHARTAFRSSLGRQSSLISKHGRNNFNFGVMGKAQSTIPEQIPKKKDVSCNVEGSFKGMRIKERRAGVHRINETGTSLPFISQSSCSNARTSFSPPLKRQSSLISQCGEGSADFGVASNMQSTVRKPLTQPEATVGSFRSHGRRTSPQYTRQMGLSSNLKLNHKHMSNEARFETHGVLQNLNRKRKTSSNGMNDKGKGKQPLGFEGNLPNVSFEISTPPSPYRSAGTQVSALNLPNSSLAPPRVASPYLSAGTQVSEMNLPNASNATLRAPSLCVAHGTQVSEVNLPNLRYMPPSAAPSCMQVSSQGSEVNLPYSSFAPPRAPSPNMGAGTQESEMSLPNSNYAPSAYVATGTQISELNTPNSSYASPEVPSPYVLTGIQVSGMSPSSSSNVPPRSPFPSVSAGMFKLPNSADYFHQNQDLASAYNSEYQNQLSIGATWTEVLNSLSPEMNSGTKGVSEKDEVLDSAPATVTSSNLTNPQEFQTNFSHGSQNLDLIMNQAAAADSPNHYRSLSESEGILRMLDEDAANFEDFSYRPNLDEKSFEWLQKNLKRKNTDPH